MRNRLYLVLGILLVAALGRDVTLAELLRSDELLALHAALGS
jgi:hypothetical protein